jgi:hypothetical protein
MAGAVSGDAAPELFLATAKHSIDQRRNGQHRGSPEAIKGPAIACRALEETGAATGI